MEIIDGKETIKIIPSKKQINWAYMVVFAVLIPVIINSINGFVRSRDVYSLVPLLIGCVLGLFFLLLKQIRSISFLMIEKKIVIEYANLFYKWNREIDFRDIFVVVFRKESMNREIGILYKILLYSKSDPKIFVVTSGEDENEMFELAKRIQNIIGVEKFITEVNFLKIK